MSRSRKAVRMTDTPLFPETHVLAGAPPAAEQGLNVTLFCGLGGACVGLERGLGQKIQWAVNHWPVAISVHRANHPDTGHMIADVREVGPLTVTGGRPVNVLWASPDCTSFSPAKGAAPVKQGLRMLPWSILMWAGKVRPRYIVGENVPAMARWWGPVVAKRKGRHKVYDKRGRLVMVNTKHPKKRDQRWRAFRRALERLGYRRAGAGRAAPGARRGPSPAVVEPAAGTKVHLPLGCLTLRGPRPRGRAAAPRPTPPGGSRPPPDRAASGVRTSGSGRSNSAGSAGPC